MHKLNLIPKDILEKRRYKRFTTIVLYLTLLILVFIISAVYYIDYKTALIDKKIKDRGTDGEVLRQSEVAKLYRDRKQRETIYDSIVKNRVLSSFIIEDITSYKPPEVLVVSVELKDKTLLVIKGRSQEIKYIVEMLSQLEELDYVDKTTLEFANMQGEQENAKYYSFEILALLKRSAGHEA